MRRRGAVLLGVLLALGAKAEIVLTDDAGRRVRLAAPARRIVTLAPSLTEAAFAAGAGARVVGVSAYSDQPPEASRLPVVSSAAGVDLEALARLSPDLVIAWQDSFRLADVPRIEALGAAVYVARARTLGDVVPVLVAVARLAGTDAGPSVRRYEERLAALRKRHSREPRLPVFLEISHRPLMTIAGRHFMGEALEACGATNVFASLPDVAPLVSWESLYAASPRAVLGAGPAAGEAAFRRDWAERSSLPAVAAGRLGYVASSALGRPSPRVVEGIEALCLEVERLRAMP